MCKFRFSRELQGTISFSRERLESPSVALDGASIDPYVGTLVFPSEKNFARRSPSLVPTASLCEAKRWGHHARLGLLRPT